MKITLPNGDVRDFPSGATGMDIALQISEGLARNAVGIFVNGKQYDLSREITEDASVKIVTFDDSEGKEIFWHSTAHLMAEALEALYPGVKFGIGPPIENGFYYDVDLPDGVSISVETLPLIENKMKELVKADSTYERIEVSWDDAVAYFREKGDEYKLELLEGLKNSEITFYRQGGFTDLCRGTHVPSTGRLKFPKLLSVAGAYWRGDVSRKMLTRIYGISFPKKAQLEEYILQREEAERRDHRKLGKELEIFTITPMIGGGLPVWLPNGTILRRRLEEFLRSEQRKRGYQEVITPHIGNLELYKTSGHYPYYADSQYDPITVDDEQYLLKPMNCPHHHQIFSSKPRSYRDLPVRLAEFGTVYRYEQSGELNGLTRVRGFTQDDAHIYCMHDQLKDEIKNVVELTQLVFKTFGMDVSTRLSFRDDNSDKYGGDISLWERSQAEIKEVADEMNLDYFIGEGEAAFYGPKIDFIVRDAIGRKWQLGTVQVDYVMPDRFQLEYTGADNTKHRPVIIHRAPFGSMERFISILIEHYAGNFPFWLAPVQVSVLPIAEPHRSFATDLATELEQMGLRVHTDLRNEKINRKIAESEQKKIPFALVIGSKEIEQDSVALREHGKGDQGLIPIASLKDMLARLNVPGAD
ncbi:MAG: threonine--tRNA ligase [Chlorobi bacterium]|nr:MAG: threonine--tRNA ligase [Bacteroidota bacterium]KXK34099.1 MAG: threonyl-tRNA synthetase [Chlorobi bacterium OLB6]MBE2266188.1 threonine--tRNA ligase [Flavobacteriales bacterium]MBL1161382.1 threonine--tRNA ligase [Chlorobiota bacterium]MBW7852669.1 threonine--tRNA ligase [Candidatus Kapabacteria bacterium]MCC6331071.1 threonine--tRNA ligase [Ignavibacteria bacterium]